MKRTLSRDAVQERTSRPRLAPTLLATFLLAATPSPAQTLLYTTSGQNGSEHGGAISGLGDIDGDGTPDFIVGAPQATTQNGSQSGRIEVFSGPGGGLIFGIDGPVANAQFGTAIAGLGDSTGDGVPDFVVGATQVAQAWCLNNPSLNQSSLCGAVYSGAAQGVGNHTCGVTLSSAALRLEIAAGQDVDGNGPDFMMSSPFYDLNTLPVEQGWVRLQQATPGSPFVFDCYGPSGGWGYHGTTPYHHLGQGLAMISDLDGDGRGEIMMGGPGGAGGLGDVVVIAEHPMGLGVQLHTLTGLQSGGEFGYAIAPVGDATGDGFEDFAVSAPMESSGGLTNNGVVRVYDGISGQVVMTLHGPMSGGRYGECLAGLPDTNGNGAPELLIGAPMAISGQPATGPGFVELVDLVGNGASLVFVNGPQSGSLFGDTVAAIGDVTGDGKSEFAVGAKAASPPMVFGYSPVILPQALLANLGGNLPGQPSLTVGPLPKIWQVTSLNLQIADAPTSASGILIISAPVPPLSVPPYFLHIDPNLAADILLPITADAAGTWSVSGAVPNDPSWAGTALQLQAAFPDSSQPHAIALTNGFAVTFGY